jgi:mono/diheme cytochrome c family protein
MKIKILLLSLVVLVCVASIISAQGRGGGGGGQQGAAASTRSATPPTSPVTGSAANGKALYFNHACYSCHGFNGETGRAFVGNWGIPLASEDNFIRFLRARQNVAPVLPSTAMPNFPENALSDKQAKDIYAYIRTFKSNAPPLENVPTLNEIVKAASRPYKP